MLVLITQCNVSYRVVISENLNKCTTVNRSNRSEIIKVKFSYYTLKKYSADNNTIKIPHDYNKYNFDFFGLGF